MREGRRIFDNILKFIKYTMTSNTGEILTLALAPLLGLPLLFALIDGRALADRLSDSETALAE